MACTQQSAFRVLFKDLDLLDMERKFDEIDGVSETKN